jgi:hypothetical protein
VFFYRCQHMRGRGRPVLPECEDFVWITARELSGYVKEEDYAQMLRYIF